jgi:alpha-L-fucosidase
VPLRRAERFDPGGMLDLFNRDGVRCFTPCAVHYDGFDLWNSAHNRWNAVNQG